MPIKHVSVAIAVFVSLNLNIERWNEIAYVIPHCELRDGEELCGR